MDPVDPAEAAAILAVPVDELEAMLADGWLADLAWPAPRHHIEQLALTHRPRRVLLAPPDGYWMAPGEAAQRLSLGLDRLWRLTRRGLIPAVRHRRRWWYRRGDLELLAAEGLPGPGRLPADQVGLDEAGEILQLGQTQLYRLASAGALQRIGRQPMTFSRISVDTEATRRWQAGRLGSSYLIGSAEAAAILGTSRKMVARLATRARLPCLACTGGTSGQHRHVFRRRQIEVIAQARRRPDLRETSRADTAT